MTGKLSKSRNLAFLLLLFFTHSIHGISLLKFMNISILSHGYFGRRYLISIRVNSGYMYPVLENI